MYFDLGIDYADLPGTEKRAKTRALVDYMQRHGRAQELLDTVKAKRPNISADIYTEIENEYVLDAAYFADDPEDDEVGDGCTGPVKILLIILAVLIAFISMIYLYAKVEKSDVLSEDTSSIIETATSPYSIQLKTGNVLSSSSDGSWGELNLYGEIVLDAQEELNFALRTGDTSNLKRFFAGAALEESFAFVGAWHQSRACYLQLEPEKDMDYFNGSIRGNVLEGSGNQTIHPMYHCNGESNSRGNAIGPTIDYSLEEIDGIWYIIEQPAWNTGLLPPLPALDLISTPAE